jgi:LysM repeat protein
MSTQQAVVEVPGMDFLDKGMDEVAAEVLKPEEEDTGGGSAPTASGEPSPIGEEASAAPIKGEESSTKVEGEGTNSAPESSTTSTGTEDDAAPLTWKPEVAALWKDLPAPIKAEVKRREADVFKGIEQYKERAVVGDKFNRVFDPYKEVMTKYNVDPVQTTANLMRIHAELSFGTQEQREDVLRRVAKDYGVDLAKIAANQALVDPDKQKLMDENRALREQIDSFTNKDKSVALEQMSAEVLAFSQDPKNVYFAEVMDDMIDLLNKGVGKDLADAYQQAVFRNPATRAKEAERLATEKAERTARQRSATSANLTSEESPAARTDGPAPTMDDTMAATLANIKKRDK